MERNIKEIDYLYQTYHDHLMETGLLRGFQPDDINDVISNLFLDLIEKKIQLTEIKNPKAYLSVAFKNRLIDFTRSKEKQKISGELPELLHFSDDTDVSMLEKIQENNELINAIKAAFENLPKRAKYILYLKYYEGLSTEEIAVKTNFTKRTVYNYLFIAIKLLRKDLNQSHPDLSFLNLLSLLPAALFLQILLQKQVN